MAGWPLAYYYPDLLPTFLCWGYTGAAYGLAIDILESKLAKLSASVRENP